MSWVARDAFARVKIAMENLEFYAVMDQHVRLRGLIDGVEDPGTASLILSGIRTAMFFNCEEEFSCRESLPVRIAEIDALSRRRSREGERLIPRTAGRWALAWSLEMEGDHDQAFMYRQSLHTAHKELAQAINAGTRKVEDHDRGRAKLVADAHADLVRSVRRCRPMLGAMVTARNQYASVLADADILTLAASPAVSAWSRRRMYSRLGFELADRAAADERAGNPVAARLKRSVVRAYLIEAVESLSARKRATALADLDAPLIEMELEMARDDGTPDVSYVKSLRDQALATFKRHSFLRRSKFLTSGWPQIESHGFRS